MKYSAMLSVKSACGLNPRGGFLRRHLVVFSALARAPARRRPLAPEDHHAAQGEGRLVGSRLPQVAGRLGHALAALMVSRETHRCGETW